MRTASRWGIVLTVGSMLASGAALAATEEKIGSWVLSCPGAAPGGAPGDEQCLLRADKRFLDKAGVTGDLEVLALGRSLVPVLTLRGLSTEILMTAALAGKTEASMQFEGGRRETLDCVTSNAAYICSPRDDAARELAAGLPAARSVTVRVSVVVAGMKPLQVQEKSLSLSGTGDALARLAVAGPTKVPGPLAALASRSPGALLGMADKALRGAGYPNGVADLHNLLNKYMNK
jgi:hypothetical protein